MAKNSNLTAAKKAKNDEFYTQKADIEAELSHYAEHFKGKVVYCNCDDPVESEFWKFFVRVFKDWGLKKLIATHYEPNEQNFSYKIEAMPDENGDFDINSEPVKTALPCNGDFRSAACIELLKEADIVVTNPPFSLFREYVAQLMEYEKKFLIIGNKNAVTYKEIFPLIRDNKLWIGCRSMNSDFWFRVPEGNDFEKRIEIDGVSDVPVKHIMGCWYTNLEHKKRHTPMDLRGETYYGHEDEYPKYDNYDAINVDSVEGSKTKRGIPGDYYGVMGVPITFLDKYCPEQFEIVAFRKGDDGKDLVFTREREREFNRTFVSSFVNGNPRDDQERGRFDKWAEYLRQNNNTKNLLEPIDIIFPLVMRGCAEPYIDLAYIQEHKMSEYKSRQVTYNGHVCQKTYHRLFIRKVLHNG